MSSDFTLRRVHTSSSQPRNIARSLNKFSFESEEPQIALMNSKPSGSRGQRTLDAWLSPSNHSPNPPSASSSSNNNRPSEGRFRAPRDNPGQRAALASIAKETRQVLPEILHELPHIQASKSHALFLSTLPPLSPSNCPQLPKTTIKIVNEDTYNAAIRLSAEIPNARRVAVLNMASHSHPGGGWLKGAMAQEEALCYRSSLALSLHKRYYPWKQRMALYTPDVVVIRGDVHSGHKLLVPRIKEADLPVVSVLSVAALRCPELATQTLPDGKERKVFKEPKDRDLTKDKMRLCLRMAASRGHRLLVLGALGCGAFRNPRREVADCWLEVLREQEFAGGWWEGLWFAVYDVKNEGNFEVFEEKLGGVEV